MPLIYFFLLPPLILSFTPFKMKAPKSFEDSFMFNFFFFLPCMEIAGPTCWTDLHTTDFIQKDGIILIA